MLNFSSVLYYLPEVVETITEILVALFVFFVFYLFGRLYKSIAVPIFKKIFKRLRSDTATEILVSMQKPILLLFSLIGIRFAIESLSFWQPITVFKFLRGSYMLAITWAICNLVDFVPLFAKNSWANAEAVRKIIRKIIKFIIFSIAVIILIDEMGYNINGLVTGLGLGGLTVSLAAKDSATNMFSGLLLLIEKPFEIGDWIICPAAEGTVEDISFRSTSIRTLENSIATVPNSLLCGNVITNGTRMNMRRTKFRIDLVYGTTRADIEKFTAAVTAMLASHHELVGDKAEVRVSGFAPSGIEILVIYFTKETVYSGWIKTNEKVNLEILTIAEETGVSFAYPTQTIHLENTAEV